MSCGRVGCATLLPASALLLNSVVGTLPVTLDIGILPRISVFGVVIFRNGGVIPYLYLAVVVLIVSCGFLVVRVLLAIIRALFVRSDDGLRLASPLPVP